MEETTDFIATELLKELKESNTRKDQFIAQSQKQHMWERLGYLITILAIVVGFLIYLNQYDFSSSEEYTYEASGVYALIDSEGNVVAQDFSAEEIARIMEVLNIDGNGESDRQETTVED